MSLILQNAIAFLRYVYVIPEGNVLWHLVSDYGTVCSIQLVSNVISNNTRALPCSL